MSKKVNIFISHKHADKKTATGLQKVLKVFDSDNLIEFHLSEEITGGENWYEWITSKLKLSNILILLFTDPTKDWDWCLYEAGLFDLMDGDHHRRTICLHSSETDPPKPLKHIKAFSARPQDIEKFLNQLFVDTTITGLERPIASWMTKAEEDRKKAVEDISKLINRYPVHSQWYTKYLILHVKDPTTIRPDRIPPDAEVEANGETLKLFDKDDDQWEWKDLEEKARAKEDVRWLEELANAIQSISKGDLFKPIQALFHPLRGTVMYRPIVHRVDKLADGSIQFKILFCEDVSWQIREAPTKLRSLLTSLVMTTRFRYELLKKYLNQNGKLIMKGPADKVCQEIRQVILCIETEASSRGLLDKESLVNIFKTAEDQQAASKMFDEWNSIRGQLLDDLMQNNCDSVEQHLNELAKMSNKGLLMAVQRFQELLD